MNKILQTALVLAILATNGLAGDIANGGAFDKGHTVEINTEIGSTITATFNANTSETSDLTITSDAKLTNKGTVEMGGESAIKNSGTFENYGTVDLSGVTNFSKYSGTITGSGSNDKIVIPANSDPSSYTGADSFTLSNASIITYNSGGVDLKKTGSGGADGKLTLISNVYTSVNTDGDNESVVAKTRFTITESTPELVNTTNYTWADLIKAGADYESDTLDIDQYGLGGMNNKFSLKSITLEYDTTIPFGLTSSNSKFKASNDQALTISGNCSGLDGGISTDGNLTFSKAAPKKGTIDCNGVLTLGESGTIDGEVQAGSLNIPYGVSVIFSNEVTTSGNNSGA